MIPGLEQAEFLRYGKPASQHLYHSPQLLRIPSSSRRAAPSFFAGQLVGVEGYTDSAAMGGLAGINAARGLAGLPLVTPPRTTAHGCLVVVHYDHGPASFSADEYEFRALSSPCHTDERQRSRKRLLRTNGR